MTYRIEFSQAVRKEAWRRAAGKCECGCGLPFNLSDPKGCPVYDHVIPAKLGGDASLENCACIRLDHHEKKTAEEDLPRIAKVRREDKRRTGTVARKAVIPGSRNSNFRKKLNGKVVPR